MTSLMMPLTWEVGNLPPGVVWYVFSIFTVGRRCSSMVGSSMKEIVLIDLKNIERKCNIKWDLSYVNVTIYQLAIIQLNRLPCTCTCINYMAFSGIAATKMQLRTHCSECTSELNTVAYCCILLQHVF